MADRSVATTDTLDTLRTTFNSTAGDVGDIASLLNASGIIASSTDIVEAVTAMNTEVTAIKNGTAVFETKITFEGATANDFETILLVTDPTADRTITFPDASGTVATTTATETFTNKTLTAPVLTSAVLNTAVSGSAVLDEDNMASNSATKLASQQSIKAYVDDSIDADMDLVFAADSGSGNIVMDSESLTLTGGTGIDTSGSSNTVTFAISNAVATLAGTETLTNKTFTSPTLNVFNFTGTNSSLGIGSGGISFEGSTADAHESLLTVVDPTQDNTITLPDASGDIITDTTNPRDTKAFLFSILMAMG